MPAYTVAEAARYLSMPSPTLRSWFAGIEGHFKAVIHWEVPSDHRLSFSNLVEAKTPSPSSAPPEPVFFVDRDLGRRFPEMLRDEGLQVEVHDDHYPGAEKPPDQVWLQMAAERGWVAVSHDANIRHTSLSRTTIADFRVRLIVVKGQARTQDLAENFLRT
jgi:hypothetical protein